MAKLLIHVDAGERQIVDADTVNYAEAIKGDTFVRRRRKRIIELGEVERAWRKHGFVRFHDNHLVHPERVLRVERVVGEFAAALDEPERLQDFLTLKRDALDSTK